MADIFSDDPEKTTDLDPNKDYFSELVGEGKKFVDAKALARGKAEADLFIEKVKQDNAELREELKQKVALQEVLDQLKQLRTEKPKEESHTPPEEERKGLTPEELEALLDSKLKARETDSIARKNQDYVQAELVKRFGSEELARAEVTRKARELDISQDVLRDMAQKTPKAFLTLVGEKTTTEAQPPRTQLSGQNSFKPTGARTKTEWDDLRKRDPVFYHSKEQTVKRHNDAIALGDRFFN